MSAAARAAGPEARQSCGRSSRLEVEVGATAAKAADLGDQRLKIILSLDRVEGHGVDDEQGALIVVVKKLCVGLGEVDKVMG